MRLRCPHCHQPIEVVGTQELSDVSCPSCGSKFNLLGGESTGTYKPEGARRLGHFELLEQLGVGHFGTVWKARDTELDRLVAIKIPRKEQLEDSDTEAFFREARAAAQLRHPNIVSVHEVGRADDTVYIASDYIQGANLKEWLTGQRLTFRESAELCVTIATALHQAHESGVIHRDLKPGNILMDMEGQPHLTDFGLAKRESGEITITLEGQILGTPAYMSPEQAKGQGHHADRRSDIYSLGVLLFELLTGELPFRGESRMLIVQILKDEPPSPRKLNARIPRDLETITLKCLSKDPARRYPTAAEVADDVQRHLRSEPILARPVSPTERLIRWCHRNPAVAILSATVVLVLLTGMAVSSFFAFQSMIRNRDLLEETKRANAKADEARRHLYSAQMNLVQRNWEDAEVGLMLDRLEKTRPQPGETDLRDFEWYYWDRLGHSSLHSKTTSGFTSVAFSADGKRLASANADYTVTVWDAYSGRDIFTLEGHTGSVMFVAFTADGKRLASASGDQTVKVWDTMSGQETLTLKGHTDLVTSVAFSPDGKRLASASWDKSVKVWDATSGQELLTLKGHTDSITSVAFVADGKWLASASVVETVKVWDATSGQEKLTLEGRAYVTSVAFSADGKRLASAIGAQQTVRVWDATSGLESFMLKGHAAGIECVAFSADGKRIASASRDKTVKVWDATNGQEILTLKGHTGPVTSVAFSANGKRLASLGGGTVKVWDAINGQEPIALKLKGQRLLTISADGKRLASANHDQTVKVWDALSGQETLTLKGHTASVTSVVISADGKRLASASEDQTVKVWDATNGQETLTLKGHTGRLTSVAFSADGKRLASASEDKTVKVWDAMSGQEMLTLKGHDFGVTCVAFTADGKRLASGSAGMTKVWNATNGQAMLALEGHSHVVTRVAFSTDGKRLASASVDGTIKLWDVTSGQESLTLKGHASHVTSVAFNADGNRLASGSYDQTVKIWDVTSGQETLTLKGHAGTIENIAFGADGKRMVSASADGTIKLWDARPWTPELRVEREALSLIHILREQGKAPNDWLDAIAADQTLSEPVRQRVLQFARNWE